MPNPRVINIALALTLCAALVACGDDQAKARGDGNRPTTVTTTVLRQQPWSDTIQALGTVKARESVTVTAKVSETVQAVHFDSGDEVGKGAPLITLTGDQQRAALAQAQATANEAERLFKRQSELAAQQLIARASLDTQRATRDTALARVAEMRADLVDRVIRAPFAGVLGLRQVSPGSLVTPGTPIATLDDLSRVYVDFPVPEGMLADLAAGQSLTATSAAYPGREFSGTVSIVDTRIDPATRAVIVRGDFANPDRALRPGLLLQVTLIQPERQALLVPEIAIVQVGNSSYVFLVQADDTVERADVVVGGRRNGLAETVSGLKAGDRIVVDGTGKLRAGDKILIKPESQADAGDKQPATKSEADTGG